jgi:hypothetical protein
MFSLAQLEKFVKRKADGGNGALGAVKLTRSS